MIQHIEPSDYNGVYLCTTWGEPPGQRYHKMINNFILHAADTGLRLVYDDYNGKSGVADGHNKLIEKFLKTDLEWMLHLDADCLITPAHMERLASWGVPIVTALTFRSKPPYSPTQYRIPYEDGWLQEFDWIKTFLNDHLGQISGIDYPPLIEDARPGSLREIEVSGSHCLLVHRKVLEDTDPPWFVPLFPSGAGSDFYFCNTVRKAGYILYCDLSVIAGHLQGDYCAGPVDWLVWEDKTTYDSENRLEFRIGETHG